MSRPISHSIITPNRVLALLGTLCTVLIAVIGYLAVSYINVYIPTRIETEVARQFHVQVKGQIADEIRNNFTVQLQTAKEDLGKKIDNYDKGVNERIDGIYGLINQGAFAPSLKRGTRRNHATLIKTLPVSRELLAHAKAKALSDPKEIPRLTQDDFIEITNNLFAKYRNPVVNEELWDTILELASYKTVLNGIEFGSAKPSKRYDEIVSLNNREFSNEVIVSRTILLGECGVTLRNVRFVDCKFQVQRGINGERLLKTLLTSDSPRISLRLDPPPGYVKGACYK